MISCDFCEKQFTHKGINRHERSCELKAWQKRYNSIEKLLNKKGCELRYDSRLCNNYVDNGIGDINEIVNIMVEMKFYINHTSYFDKIECEIMQSLRNDGYYNRDHESYLAKGKALHAWCKQYKNSNDINYDILPNTLHQTAYNIVQYQMKKKNEKNDILHCLNILKHF
jgi:hypothetical protein